MARLVVSGFGYFPEKPADKSFDRRQVGFDPTDDRRLNIGAFNCFDGGGIKLRMIHAKDRFGPGIFQLVVELICRIEGIAGNANGTGF
jgi:hypothetical protein